MKSVWNKGTRPNIGIGSLTMKSVWNKGTRPNIGIGSHRCRSIGHRFFPIPLKVGPDFIGTEWNGIGNGSQVFIGPINKGHQKYLAAQITRHKSKSKSVNVVSRYTNTLNFQFKCCRPADKVFLLIINIIFLINVSCLSLNLTSQFRTFVCIYLWQLQYDQKILNLCIKMGTVLYLQARPATRNARHDGNEPRSTLRFLQSF